jgi:hypothetical protein
MIVPTEVFALMGQPFYKRCPWRFPFFLEGDLFVCAASTADPITRMANFFPIEHQLEVNVLPDHRWEIFQLEDEQIATCFDNWASTVEPEWNDEPFLGERFLAYTIVGPTGETLSLFHNMPEETGYWVIRLKKRVLILTTSHTLQCDRLLLRVVREMMYRLWENHGGIALHAAALQWKERGLLLVGPHGAGKTTLLLHLLAWQRTAYIGNDHIFVSCPSEGQSSPLIRGGLPLVVRCGQEMLAAKPYLQPLASGDLIAGKHEVMPKALIQALGCRFLRKRRYML